MAIFSRKKWSTGFGCIGWVFGLLLTFAKSTISFYCHLSCAFLFKSKILLFHTQREFSRRIKLVLLEMHWVVILFLSWLCKNFLILFVLPNHTALKEGLAVELLHLHVVVFSIHILCPAPSVWCVSSCSNIRRC